MNIINFPQGTEEWLRARAGHVTASKIADIMAKGKSGAASKARRCCGVKPRQYGSAAQ